MTNPLTHRRNARAAAISAAALVAVLVAATSVVAATQDTHAAKTTHMAAVTTITFRAHEVIKPKLFDIAKPAGPSIGDELIEKEILYANGKRIGYDLIHFTPASVTRNGPDVIAQGVLVLEDGTINFLGETTFRSIRVGVVGGTGAYQGVTGQLTILRTLKNGDDIDALRLVRPAKARVASETVGASQTMKFALAYHDVQFDLGEKGPSVGDERIFADSLLDAKGRKVGHDSGVCTFTSLTPPEAACHITFFLPRGEIATQFLNAPPPRKVAAIAGGTGAYRAARGEAVMVEGPNQTGSVTFSLAR